ncbi:MAG TPA: diacylglycerol kinase family protein [Ktedonobacterales bacterium]
MSASSGRTPPDAQRFQETARGASAPRIPPTSRHELTAFFRSFVYAWRGLVHAVRTQRNARVHMLLGSAAIILGLILRISPLEFAMIFVAITLVFIAEMFNTVAEACIDLVTTEYHPLARIAKDVAAGAVLLNAMLSVVIGLLVFVPHLVPLALRLISR